MGARGGGGRLRAAIEAFADNARNPAVRRIQLGYAGACTAGWTFQVVLAVYAFNQGGAAAVGLVTLVRMLPSALLAPFLSALADRRRRDRALLVVYLVRALTAAGMALVVLVQGSPVLVYGLAVVSTAAGLLYRPVSSALLPLLCRTPSELASTNVVRGLLDSISTLVGPAIAAGLLALDGAGWGFTAVAVFAGISAVATVGLHVEEPTRTSARVSVLAGLWFGAQISARSGGMRVMLTLLAAQVVTRGAVSVFSVLIAVQLLGMGEPGVGTLTAAVGAGAIIGSLFASVFVGSHRLAVWFGTGVALWGVPLILLALAPHRATALTMMACLGVGNALVDVGLFTLVARLVPERALGRVFGLLECIGGLALGGGSMLAAWLAAADLREALWIVGAIGPAFVLVFWFPLRRLDDAMTARDEDLALLRRVAVFDPLPLPALEQLATGLRSTRVPSGETLITQGEQGPDGCFVIAHGEAEVLGDGRHVTTVGPGELVGEIALLHRVSRTATVRALTDMDVKYLEADRFLLVVTGWESSRELTHGHVDELLVRFSPGSDSE